MATAITTTLHNNNNKTKQSHLVKQVGHWRKPGGQSTHTWTALIEMTASSISQVNIRVQFADMHIQHILLNTHLNIICRAHNTFTSSLQSLSWDHFVLYTSKSVLSSWWLFQTFSSIFSQVTLKKSEVKQDGVPLMRPMSASSGKWSVKNLYMRGCGGGGWGSM